MMELYKYVALGNDFLITEFQESIDYKKYAKSILKPHLGIGSDGLIVVNSKTNSASFYNVDGSSASMCGNGIRCVFLYLYKKNPKEKMILKVNDIFYDLHLVSLHPFTVDVHFPKRLIDIKNFEIDSLFGAYSVFVGNSHLVIFDDNEKILKMMKKDDKELYRTNINVVTPLTKNMIKVDTFEKGVGRTLSCGTGALASSIAYKLKTDCKEDIIVHYELGELNIKEDEYCYHLIGEARFLAKIEANI